MGAFEPGAFTILIAEDDPPIRLLLKTILQRAGYLTLEARTGEEALERIREGNVSIVLLDLMMPGLNGFDVVNQLRIERPELLSKVMIVTAASDRDIARVKREDVCHVLRKPFDFRELLTLLEECCRGLSPRNSGAL